jgi:hypothetical protein
MGFINITPDKLSELLKKAEELVKSTNDKASSLKIGDRLKEELYTYSEDIKLLVNGILAKNGVITKEEIDELDEKSRLAKKKMLEAQAKADKKKIIIYTSSSILVLGVVWYLIKKAKK